MLARTAPMTKDGRRVPSSRRRLLVFALIGLLLAYPYATRGLFGQTILVLATAFTLAAGVYSVSNRQRDLVLGATLATLQVASTTYDLLQPEPALSPLSIIFLGLFCTFAMLRNLEFALAPGQLTADRLYASVACYLLIGLVFACLYTLCAQSLPGSFEPADAGFLDLTYFSLVTLTTLGYGDILPVAKQARSLAALEAVSGVLYLALLVARLVGLYATGGAPDPAKR